MNNQTEKIIAMLTTIDEAFNTDNVKQYMGKLLCSATMDAIEGLAKYTCSVIRASKYMDALLKCAEEIQQNEAFGAMESKVAGLSAPSDVPPGMYAYICKKCGRRFISFLPFDSSPCNCTCSSSNEGKTDV